ncbi:RICIN domain-containing protein [Lentzea sp. NPDC004782]|uniref:ricin-type beta-trefoil lectin domain protein n=1 Tax=Lentzea sp. NPDC004782 TaxID=3154458 RepID=UPI0033A335CA
MVSCAGADAQWVATLDDQDRYRLKDPGSARYLVASGTDQVRVGTGGDTWFLTPVNPVRVPAQSDPRLDEVTFLTAHNAYANDVDGGFTFGNVAPNQSRGVVQQLGDGVRGFMLNIHQTSDGAILCHNSCTFVSKPVALAVDLQRIVDFLKSHPTEIVTVFLEDHVDAHAPNYLAVDFYHLNTPSLTNERHPSGAGSVELPAASTLCLDNNAGGTTNGTTVQLWDCNGSGAQQWRVRFDGSVQNPQPGLCLDDPGASTTPGTRLTIWTRNGAAAQAWRFR